MSQVSVRKNQGRCSSLSAEKKKKCTYCGKNLGKRFVDFINIGQGTSYLFCGQKCKKAWLSERIHKSQIDGVEWTTGDIPIIKKPIFDESGNLKTKSEKKAHCQYCNSEWPSNASKVQHERWCDENPNKRTYRSRPKTSKPKLIKEGSRGEIKKGDIVTVDLETNRIIDSKPPEITVKELIVLGLDTRELIEAFQHFFNNKEAILKRIDKLVKQWKKEDSEP